MKISLITMLKMMFLDWCHRFRYKSESCEDCELRFICKNKKERKEKYE